MATKKSPSAKKKSSPPGGRPAAKKTPSGNASKKRWVRTVTTDSTHPPKDLFTRSAPEIARSLASKKVSPKGPGSGMRMLTYFINRAGKGLSASRRRELDRAKELLHERIETEKQKRKQERKRAA
ncbi:MAG: DUF3175 domain-containing protein [Acidobacteriota bacterium]